MADNPTAGSIRGFSAVPMIYFKDLVLEPKMDIADWFVIASGLDLDATELHDKALRSHDPSYLEMLGERLAQKGLQVSQVVGSADLTNPDPEVRAAELERTKRDVDVASALGATCVRLTAGQAHPGLSHEEGVRYAVEGFRRALDYAEGKGVWLAYENHYKDYFWPLPDFSQHAAVFLEILNALHDTPLRVNFDCSNQVMVGEDPVELLRQVRDRVVHVHCSDRVAPNEYRHAVSGEGVVDFPAIFRLLREIDYDGWLSVEYNGTEGLDGLRRSVENVRRLWAEADRGTR